jgi:Flp pilus assembly protein TadG
MVLRSPHPANARSGAAAVEFAIILPLLMFLFGIGVDWARAFYFHLAVTNASRNGALYGCESPDRSVDTAGIQAAVLRDTTSLGAGVTVESSVVTANSINYVKVKVSYTFSSLTRLPGTPSTQVINQTTEMRIMPTAPRDGTY